MRNYFGTDGIRGIVNEYLTGDLAFKCGNSLARLKKKPLVLIGRDTRISGDMLTLSFSSGAISAGAEVYDLGIIPTAGIAYLTKELGADFGVVISASHNTAEYNGIKIFSSSGYKIDESTEDEIEKSLNLERFISNKLLGRFSQKFQFAEIYASQLKKACKNNLEGLKIALDLANGAAYKIAPKVFNRLGASCICISSSGSGLNINDNCGSLHTEKLSKIVVENSCDAGFAYDGDADRLIAVDEKGNVVDGDKILYILSCYYKENNLLKNDLVVGTAHTNMGIINSLKNNGINLIRSDIGDKYVIELMNKKKSVIGGEQSGHIIQKRLSTTGDGILTSISIASILSEKHARLSELSEVDIYPQTNINIAVKDKVRVLNNDLLSDTIEIEREKLGNEGRIVVRASGTEQVIRIFTETKDKTLSEEIAKRIAEVIKGLE